MPAHSYSSHCFQSSRGDWLAGRGKTLVSPRMKAHDTLRYSELWHTFLSLRLLGWTQEAAVREGKSFHKKNRFLFRVPHLDTSLAGFSCWKRPLADSGHTLQRGGSSASSSACARLLWERKLPLCLLSFVQKQIYSQIFSGTSMRKGIFFFFKKIKLSQKRGEWKTHWEILRRFLIILEVSRHSKLS